MWWRLWGEGIHVDYRIDCVSSELIYVDYRKIRVDFEKKKIVGIHMDSSKSTWILLKSTLNFNFVIGVDSN